MTKLEIELVTRFADTILAEKTHAVVYASLVFAARLCAAVVAYKAAGASDLRMVSKSVREDNGESKTYFDRLCIVL